MPNPRVPAAPGHRRTRTTRARILEAARRELDRDPDRSLGDIAEAAGVSRRTVYGHFAGRSALVEGLVDDAVEALRAALTAVALPASDAPTALARFVLTLWPVGDRYRMLLRLAPQDLGAERADLLAPARDMATAIITEGRRQGVFHTSLPPPVLSRAVEAYVLTLLECGNTGTWTDDGTRTAAAALIAVGFDGDPARCGGGPHAGSDPGTRGMPRVRMDLPLLSAVPPPRLSVTKPAARVPQRRNARSNRARILATARKELGRNPDITLEELARAAGVVRRTLFGHFPGRVALLEALAEEASESFRDAAVAGVTGEGPAERALAQFALSMWPVGDRYRMLLALARHDLGAERVTEIIKPARDEVTSILERGQRDGVFHTHLPPAVLSAGLEALTVALLEQVNVEALEDDGTRSAIAMLIAAGVPEKQACAVVGDVAATVTGEATEATETAEAVEAAEATEAIAD